MRIVYGPIRSLGLGRVVAVDPIGRSPKVCNLNCIYCHLGCGGMVLFERSEFIDDASVLDQIGECLHREECESVMFKGTGETLLARNIFHMAKMLREGSDKKVALFTNSTLLNDPEILGQLDAFDIIIAKLDAASEEKFQTVNRPHPSIRFQDVLEGIKKARESFAGSFRLHVTVVRENLSDIDNISQICREICPDYVYLESPEGCDPSHTVCKKDMQAAMDRFFGIRCVSSQDKE
ncbi:MAG TPA: radical SAM protein [Methanomassiliicoccales archaeon]|nr:radical SAM protein [Methanomassiliicoccales archaeon]